MVQGLRLARKAPCHLVRHQQARDAVVRRIAAACNRAGVLGEASVLDAQTLLGYVKGFVVPCTAAACGSICCPFNVMMMLACL